MSSFDTSSIVNLIAAKAMNYQSMAENFAKSRFLLASIEYGQNDKETDALQKIAAGIKCNISMTDTGVQLEIDFDDKDTGNYLEIVEEGMPAPLAGGSGGIAHNPDGTTYRSEYPPALWGTPLEELSKPESDTLAEVKMMLQQLFADEVRNIVQESKQEITTIVKNYVMQELNNK